MLFSLFLVVADCFVVPGQSRRQSTAMSAGSDWEKEYKNYIKRNGMHLAGMSWRGYEKLGIGCIVTNYDVKDAAIPGEAFKSMYVPESKFGGVDEEEGVKRILDRLKEYEPERQFVVVFTTGNVMGVDIVTPNIPPPQVSRLPAFQEAYQSATIK